MALSAAVSLAIASVSHAGVYTQLAPFSAVVPAGAPSSFSSGAVVGNSAFALLNGTGTSQISQTINLANSPSSTTFTSNSLLTGVGSPNATGQLYDSGNGYLDLLDSNTSEHQILHIDESSGAVSVFASKTVLGSDSLGTAYSPIPGTGDMAWYDNTNHQVVSSGNGSALTVLIPNASLVSTTNGGPGNQTINYMLVALPGGNYLTDNSTSKTIFEYNTGTSSWSSVLTAAQIESVTGNAGTSGLVTANLYGPDGNVYFFDNTAKEILEFNPSNPVGSLSIAVPASTITSVEGTTVVSNLSWYNGAVAWDNITPTGEGFYGSVPEPGTLSLLGLASLGLLRRRAPRSR